MSPKKGRIWQPPGSALYLHTLMRSQVCVGDMVYIETLNQEGLVKFQDYMCLFPNCSHLHVKTPPNIDVQSNFGSQHSGEPGSLRNFNGNQQQPLHTYQCTALVCKPCA